MAAQYQEIVMRFFFDVLGSRFSTYDYHGQYFDRQEDAADMARLIAMDLGTSETNDWVGSQVKVRCVAGQTLFSVPIRIAA
jgi:hypothetical protein